MNEITLSNDLKTIELEINHHKNIAGQSIWEIGRRLNHVKENDLAHGEFGEWRESVGFSETQARRFMTVARELNSPTSAELGLNALYLIAKLPEPERTKEHVTTKGETKTPDEMTVRELQDLKKQLKQKEEENKHLKQSYNEQAQEVQRLKNKPAEVIEREVVIEKVPDDYHQIKGLYEADKNATETYRLQNEELRSELKELEKALNSNVVPFNNNEELIDRLKTTITGLENWIKELKQQIKKLEGE